MPPVVLSAESFVKNQLRARIQQGIDTLRDRGIVPADLATPDFVVERPEGSQPWRLLHECRVAARQARALQPARVAQALIDALPAGDDIAAWTSPAPDS